nr:ATP-grasp fold amidoligase family protein [Vibrio harveyi]
MRLRLRLFYYYKFRTFLNLKYPSRLSEKIQVRKLNILPEYSTLSDKYSVRDYVKDKVGDSILIPLIDVVDNASELNFEQYQNEFVIKTNHGSGASHIEIVRDKSIIDESAIKKKFKMALSENYLGSFLGESQYDSIDRKLVVEELIKDPSGCDILDYKFHMFHGKDGFIQVDLDRFSCHKRNLYDFKGNLIDGELHYPSNTSSINPDFISEMLPYAIKLADGFEYVRVDLYFVDGKVYFGEMTFTPGSGFEVFRPASLDLYYGDKW